MKKRTIAFIMAMICLCMTVSASAVEARRASSKIYDSSIQVMASGGHINIEFYVTGNGTMDKLGCESIVEVTVFAENDAGRDTRSQTFYVTGE